MGDSTAVLDRRQFEQALLVLNRERPSASDEIRFKALTAMVWTAVGLTIAWIAAFNPLHSLAWFLIRAAAAAYALSIALFFANLGLAAKLWRGAAARRRLRLIPYLKSFVRARRRQHWPTHLLSYGLAGLGLLLCAFGAWGGVMEWLATPDPNGTMEIGMLLAGGPWLFGLACLLMYFVVQGRDSMAAIADLYATLVASDKTGECAAAIPPAVYDEITVIEREQIKHDRTRSIAAAHGATPSLYAVRISRDVYARVPELIPDDWQAVNRRIRQLQSPPEAAIEPGRTPAEIAFVSVPPTAWEIGVRLDHDRQELQLVVLRRVAEDDVLGITP